MEESENSNSLLNEKEKLHIHVENWEGWGCLVVVG